MIRWRRLPPGVRVEGPSHEVAATDVRFLHDLTWHDGDGSRLEQQIFDRVFELVERSERLLVLDFFLYNDFAGVAGEGFRLLADQLTERLVARRARGGPRILLITDPVNEHYGGARSRHLDRLRASGIEVVVTRLDRLPDSNPLYSAWWRFFVRWLGNSTRGGWLPSPVDPDRRVTLRTYLELFNFKANHRKVVIADEPGGVLSCLVSSANPHDASSRHSNVALEVRGAPAIDLLDSELAIARFSGWQGELPRPTASSLPSAGEESVGVRAITESAIERALLERLTATGEGDRVDVAIFYLADRHVIDALVAAAERGTRVRLLLDPNHDAFGREKRGIPNRPVARELRRRGDGRIDVRWYRTAGEQFHTKLILVRRGGTLAASLGSTNLTRRNLHDFNLEANLEVGMPAESELARQLEEYFERLWSNRGGEFSQEYSAWEDRSRLKYWRYRLMEATGLSAF